jgi:hypothetical protein
VVLLSSRITDPYSGKEQEMLKLIKRRNASKGTVSDRSLASRAVSSAKATLCSSLSTEEKLSWLSIGIWIPYRYL